VVFLVDKFKEGITEEQINNLLYVACTRAKEKLVMFFNNKSEVYRKCQEISDTMSKSRGE